MSNDLIQEWKEALMRRNRYKDELNQLKEQLKEVQDRIKAQKDILADAEAVLCDVEEEILTGRSTLPLLNAMAHDRTTKDSEGPKRADRIERGR
jgi:chromosome segregation ATPase